MLLKTNVEKMSLLGLCHYIYENKRLISFLAIICMKTNELSSNRSPKHRDGNMPNAALVLSLASTVRWKATRAQLSFALLLVRGGHNNLGVEGEGEKSLQGRSTSRP